MKIELYTTKFCPYCVAAKQFLDSKSLKFEDTDVSGDSNIRAKASKRAGGFSTVPMIFINDKFIGGYTELVALNQSGELDNLLAEL